MNDNFIPYLCGGILFSFLIELHNDTATKFNNTWETKKAINQNKIMEKLICAIHPNNRYNYNAESSTFKKTVSEYHTCKTNGGKVLPFERDFTKTEFDKCVKNQYEEALKHMTKFTVEYFPTYNDAAICRLVKRTLILIRDDISIDDDALFFINSDGSSISKKDLLEMKEFNFQSFLVGIWHYIITKPTENEKGRETFEKLFRQYKKKEPKLDTSCLKPYAHEINVTWNEASEKSIPKENNECESKVEPPKTDKKEKLGIKIYYKGGLLETNEENAILSFAPGIIDLDENPNITIKDSYYGPIYKITTELQMETYLHPNVGEIIRLYYNIGPFKISGTTSEENWISKSKLNNFRFHKKEICTTWFRLDHCNEYEYNAEFYMIGKILQ